MALSAFNFSRWIEEHAHLLKPPVDEFFYQLRGDIVLKAVEDGKPRDIPIREGEILLIPAHFRHSPQRPANVQNIVTDLPPLFAAFYESPRKCPQRGHIHPGKA